MIEFSDYEKEVFKDFSKEFKKHTIDDYHNKLLLFKSMLNEKNKDLFTANIEDAKKFIESIQSTYAKSTCEKIYSYQHSFYNFLLENGYIDTNIFKHVEKPSVTRVKSKDNVLSYEEANKIASILPDLNTRDRAIVSIFMTTGCLLSELAVLKWTDITIDNDTFYCNFGEGKKKRIIKLHPYTVNIIMQYRDILGLSQDDPTDDYIFKGRSKEHMTNRNIQAIVKKALKLAGLENYSCKDFRHSFATICLRLGADEEDLKQYMGWSNKFYAKRYKYVLNFIDDQVIDNFMSTDKLLINKQGEEDENK